MIKINVSNKVAYTLIVILAVLTLTLGVYAVWSPTPSWHSGNEVKVNVGGTDYSLQEAITTGKIATTISSNCNELRSTKPDTTKPSYVAIPIPSGCMDNKGCLINLIRYNEANDRVVSILSVIYAQATDAGANKLWTAFGSSGNAAGTNGDNSEDTILGPGAGHLSDDRQGTETASNQWTLVDNDNDYFKLEVCTF